MRRLLHPDPKEVERILGSNIWCPAMQASISPDQCRTNRRRAKKLDATSELNYLQYQKCLSCPGVDGDHPIQSSTAQRISCTKCRRRKDPDHFETNPQTQKPYRMCRSCREEKQRSKDRNQKRHHAPIATITGDGKTITFNAGAAHSLDAFQSHQFVRFARYNPLQLVFLQSRKDSHTYKLTKKGSPNQTPSINVCCATMIDHVGLHAGQRFHVTAKSKNKIQLDPVAG